MTKPLNLPSVRLYSSVALARGGAVPLDVSQSHYLINVMRIKSGAHIRLFHDSSGEWLSEIQVTGKHAVALPVEQTRNPALCPDIMLAFSPLKSGKTEDIIEKGTELGVRAFYPIITKHTVVDRIKEDKLRAHAVEASEQAERIDVPVIHPLQLFAAFIDALPPETTLIYGDESGQGAALGDALPPLQQPALCALVGPEGGFSAVEFSMLRRRSNTIAVTLGPRILKADTAAFTLLACLACRYGDWQEKPSFRSPMEASC